VAEIELEHNAYQNEQGGYVLPRSEWKARCLCSLGSQPKCLFPRLPEDQGNVLTFKKTAVTSATAAATYEGMKLLQYVSQENQ
jgi:hypothetical protein